MLAAHTLRQMATSRVTNPHGLVLDGTGELAFISGGDELEVVSLASGQSLRALMISTKHVRRLSFVFSVYPAI